jgi:hypothetical protein
VVETSDGISLRLDGQRGMRIVRARLRGLRVPYVAQQRKHVWMGRQSQRASSGRAVCLRARIGRHFHVFGAQMSLNDAGIEYCFRTVAGN